MDIREVYNNIRGLNLRQLATDAAMDVEQDILDAVRDQLAHGLKPSGDIIGEYAPGPYALRKNRMNPLPGFGVVDLHLTGHFYTQLYIDPRSSIIHSAAPYYGDLEDKYGETEDFLGLSDESISKIKPKFEAALKRRLEDAISH